MSKLKKKTRSISLSRACRTCLSERGYHKDILETRISHMLEKCASVQVSEDDGLPKLICVTCFRQILKFYAFTKKIECSQKILLRQAKENKPIKIRKAKKYCLRSDILYKAVNEAEIGMHSEEGLGQEIEPDYSFNDNCSDVSEEDIPLSKRKLKTEKHEDDKLEEIQLENFKIDYQIKEDIANTSDLIFSDGPPPLIPIQTALNINEPISEDFTAKNNLLIDTPPLIPIKPSLITTEIEKLAPIDVMLECIICGEDFDSVNSLKQHRLSECRASGLQCNICKKNFKERKKLIGHLKGHMISKDYACKLCHKRYPNPSTMAVHMRTHTGERPFKCQVCNKGFVRWAGVVGHMRTHNSNKPYKCDTCDKAFKIQSNLERHKVLHTGSLPFCCCYCGKTFSQSDNLQLHVRTYHTFEKPYLCNECGKGFVSSTRLTRHMWVHSGHKPYRCKQCTKSYANSNDLKIHARIHSGGITEADKPHACNLCEMRFFHACRLFKHMKIHDRKNCTQCHKSYPTHFLLNRHIEEKHLQTTYVMNVQTENNVETFVDDPGDLLHDDPADLIPDDSIPINEQEVIY